MDKLFFNKNGKFKILQISDIQDGPLIIPIVRKFIKSVVYTSKPDIIILTGDNIGGYSCKSKFKAIREAKVKSAIWCFMSVFEKAGIPVALVFGNHDAEKTVSKEEQMNIYAKYSCCIAEKGEKLYGCGNYNVPVYSSGNGKIAYNLWLIDSNMYDKENGGYDYVHKEQIDWYTKVSQNLKSLNNGKPVPSMMFMHTVVADIWDYMLEVPASVKDSVSENGKNYIINPEYLVSGVMHEAPSPSKTNSGLFAKCIENGDVKAIHFGHDHVNNYVIDTKKGIHLINTPGITFGSYGDETRAVREIILDESNPDTYETKLISYTEQFKNNPLLLSEYKITVVLHDFLEKAGKKIRNLKK